MLRMRAFTQAKPWLVPQIKRRAVAGTWERLNSTAETSYGLVFGETMHFLAKGRGFRETYLYLEGAFDFCM